MTKKIILSSIFSMALLISHVTYAQQKEVKGNQTSKENVNSEITKAKDLFKEGKKADASKILTNIMKTNPDNREAVQMWLMINMKRSPTAEVDAVKLLDSLGKIYPKNTGILFFTTFLQCENGMNDKALVNVEKLIKVQADSSDNWILKGQILSALKKHEQALTSFEKALTLNPNRSDVWGMKASAQAKLGKMDDAIATCNKIIELFPKDESSLYNRACIYSLKGDKANALKDLTKALGTNKELKEQAKKDEDFKSLWDDADFKKLTE